MAHVFISYAHVDADFVSLLSLELEKAGFTAWVDSTRLRAGEDWRSGIDEAIQAAFALIAVMTPEAYQSQYVTYEWAFALGIGIKVIPLLLRRTALHPRLETLQYLDFTAHGERPWDRLSEHLDQIENHFTPNKVYVPRDAPDAVKQAVAKLDSHYREERIAALDSLAQMNHVSALEALAGAVQHPTRDVQIEAAFRLAEITRYKDQRATGGLITGLDSSDSKTAYRAADILRKMRDPNAIQPLINALHREDGRVRRAAATALAQLNAAAVPALISELEHRDERVRENAIWALGEIHDSSVLDSLPSLIKALHSSRTTLVMAAQDAILKIGDAAIPELSKSIKDLEWNIRLTIVRLLGEIGNPIAIPVLVQALTDENTQVIIAAIEALGVVGDESVVPSLARAIHDSDSYEVRCAAAVSLGAIGNFEATAELIRILEDDLNVADHHSNISISYIPALHEVDGWSKKHFLKTVAETLLSINTSEAVTTVKKWRANQGSE